jgi:signal transduction histidine kinase
MVQELRTPMTSVIGYVDLLLGESAGILGEMQRKFLLRVNANVSRLASMLEDLIRVTMLDSGQFQLMHEPVDVIGVIEDAITNASEQLREKGLTVHLNLDDDVPDLPADPDAIHQIVGQLLTNAYLASPPGSEFFITARRQPVKYDAGRIVDSLYIAVEDRGGGIASEDQGRVFSRKYKAENPLIQGLGDTGVGLSIAKALVEAHGGRIWLETREGVGVTFSLAMPLEADMEPQGQP